MACLYYEETMVYSYLVLLTKMTKQLSQPAKGGFSTGPSAEGRGSSKACTYEYDSYSFYERLLSGACV